MIPELDQNALSRLLAAYGAETQLKLMGMRVFIQGLRGVPLSINLARHRDSQEPHPDRPEEGGDLRQLTLQALGPGQQLLPDPNPPHHHPQPPPLRSPPALPHLPKPLRLHHHRTHPHHPIHFLQLRLRDHHRLLRQVILSESQQCLS